MIAARSITPQSPGAVRRLLVWDIPGCTSCRCSRCGARLLSSQKQQRASPFFGTNKTTEIVVATLAVGTLVGANFMYQRGHNVANVQESGDDGDDSIKFPRIARTTRDYLQKYLSIVADGEKYDTLQRLEKIASLESKQDRQRIVQREWNAVRDDPLMDEMSERNRNLLRRHLVHQQELVQLLTCEKAQDNDKMDVCSEIMGRALSESDIKEARRVAGLQLQKLMNKTRDLCEEC